MIRVTASYPSVEGKRFDLDYYLKSHVPMIDRLLKPVRQAIWKGNALDGGRGPYVLFAELYFESAEAFATAFGAHKDQILGDIGNYAEVPPTISIDQQLV
jgi:uncharacterized protein (TIGR02118 family)